MGCTQLRICLQVKRLSLIRMKHPRVSVRAAWALQPPAHVLPHVAHAIEAYLVDSRWMLESASKRGFFRLLDHLLTRERPAFNQKCHELRLKAGVEAAVRYGYDLRVLEWWLKRYMPIQKVISSDWVFKLAIRHAQIPVLEWLYQETNGDLPRLETAVKCFDPNTVIWLYEHGRRHSSAQLEFQNARLLDCPIEASIQCLIYEEEEGSSFTAVNAETMILRAIKLGRLEQVQWLYKHRPEHFKRNYLGHGVYSGRLDVVKWLYKQFPKHYFDAPDLRYLSSSWLEFEIIRWVLCEFEWATQAIRQRWISDTAKVYAGNGSLETLKLFCQTRMDRELNDNSFGVDGLELSPVGLEDAAANGHLAIIQWVYAQSSQAFAPRAMDRAAGNGRLAVVQWLHENRSDGCTTEAMDSAAANGHLAMVQWLHEHRLEGCTTKAMDQAARGGHLEVVIWLHENRSEGCTTHAMDNAAAAGYVTIVQWLHENRDEGCTARAMTCAAYIGRLDILRFLHEKRQEPCTVNALHQAGMRSHFATFQWLYENRSDSFYAPEWNNHLQSGRPGPYFKCLALYTAHDRHGWVVDIYVEAGDFETVELLLVKAHAARGALLESRYAMGS